MKTMCFDLSKYHKALQKEDISPSVRLCLEQSDAKFNGKDVVFHSWSEPWGILVDDKTLVHRTWCSKKKSRFRTWADTIGDRIKEFEEME